MVQDLRFALRSLRKNPGFTLAAVVALALGMGATAAVFSVINGVLLRPLAYSDADALVVVLHHGSDPVAPANFLDWRRQVHSFAGMEAAEYWTPTLAGVGQTERLPALRVTAGMFSLLGAKPLLGRTFVAGEDEAGRDRVVVLSYGVWSERFGGDQGVLGRAILLDGKPFTVIGVMPRGFRFAPFWATKAQMWAPLVLASRASDRGGESLRVFARLRPGGSLVQARSEVAVVTARLERAYAGTNQDVRVLPLKEKVVGDVRPALLLLLSAVAFLLLIACANVSHLLLARTAARRREIAVRRALGARRFHLLRQFLTENLLLAGIAGTFGLLLADLAVRALPAIAPGILPRLDAVRVDWRVCALTALAALLTAALLAILSALESPALGESLKQGGHGATGGRGSARLRGWLVASEFALALMLLAAAGLMLRSFVALVDLDPGFNPHHVLSFVVSVNGTREASPAPRIAFYQQLLQQLQAVPGVTAAGAVNHMPLTGDLWRMPVYIEGRPLPAPSTTLRAVYRVVLPGYFRAMQLPLLRGRDIAGSDTLDQPAIAVINQRLAQVAWPGEDPIGKRLTLDAPASAPRWITVAGVVKDARQDNWAAAPQPEIYLPLLQDTMYLGAGEHVASMTFVVRASGDAAALAPSVVAQVRALDKNVPVSQVITLEDAITDANARPRLLLWLLGSFSSIALLLAALGIYAVVSYSVSRRTREIGVRLALGASRREVGRLMVREGMLLAGAGCSAGMLSSLLLARFLGRLLYGVGPADPLTFVVTPLLLLAVALLANIIPARRAMRLDPMLALRQE